ALPLPLGQAFTAEAAMKIMIAMSFMFAFCRRRWSELASAFGAVSFGYCTFVQTWLHFPLVTVAVFIPAAFLTLDLLLERPTRLRFMGVVAVWAVMLLGGHPLSAALLRPRAAGESVGTGGRRVDHRIRGRPRRRRVVRTVDPRDRAAALAESGDVLRLRQRDRPGNHSRVAGGEQSVSSRLRPGRKCAAATAPLLASRGDDGGDHRRHAARARGISARRFDDHRWNAPLSNDESAVSGRGEEGHGDDGHRPQSDRHRAVVA